MRVGQRLTARLEALDLECQATISEVVPRANIASRSFEVKVTGPCPEGVYSGMFGRLLLPLGEEQILQVPATAIHRVGQLTFVQVVSNHGLSRRFIQLGRTLTDGVEVLSGLHDGEQVLLRQSASTGEVQ